MEHSQVNSWIYVTWILNKQSWLINVPCSIKINNHDVLQWTFLGILKVTVYLPCIMQGWTGIIITMQGWRMNEIKTEWNLLLLFYWSISKMKYFTGINNAKGKHLLKRHYKEIEKNILHKKMMVKKYIYICIYI